MLTHQLVTTPEGFEVHLGERQITYPGATMQEAYSRALTGVCRLGRYGALDPGRPEEVGLGGETGGNLGHVIALAAELVQENVRLTKSPDDETRRTAKQRLGALATALAALTRVDMD